MDNIITDEMVYPPLGDGGIWFKACTTDDVPENGGVCVKYKDEQIALFHFTRRGEWYASQNQCPHRMQMALSRGMIGSHQGEPKIACPFHKKTFSLVTGECLSGDECSIKTYPVRVENNYVLIGMPHPPEGEGGR
ncbi:MAG: nitrite reductase small subunit NirD [Ginsengibacter sp.]